MVSIEMWGEIDPLVSPDFGRARIGVANDPARRVKVIIEPRRGLVNT
jgi:hypothetical protein